MRAKGSCGEHDCVYEYATKLLTYGQEVLLSFGYLICDCALLCVYFRVYDYLNGGIGTSKYHRADL